MFPLRGGCDSWRLCVFNVCDKTHQDTLSSKDQDYEVLMTKQPPYNVTLVLINFNHSQNVACEHLVTIIINSKFNNLR